MSHSFDIMDAESGNMVGSFASEREAIELALRAFDRWGAPGVAGLVLYEIDGESVRLVAEGMGIAFLSSPTMWRVNTYRLGVETTAAVARVHVTLSEHHGTSAFTGSQVASGDLACV